MDERGGGGHDGTGDVKALEDGRRGWQTFKLPGGE